MPEVTEYTPEIQMSPTPASEVFKQRAEIIDEIESSRLSGDIEIVPTDNPRDFVGKSLTPNTLIDSEDVTDDTRGVYDLLPVCFGDISELKFVDQQEIDIREATEVQNEVIDYLVDKNAWYLAEPEIAKLLDSGEVSQLFRLLGPEGMNIDIVNFSKSLLTDKHLQDIQTSIIDLYNLSGGALADTVRAICVLPKQEFEPHTLGTTSIKSGVVRINEATLSEEEIVKMEQETGKNSKKFGSSSAFKLNLSHELTHLIEGVQNFWSDFRYQDALGWRSSEYNSFVDDFGNVVKKEVSAFHMPNRKQKVFEEGDYKTVDVVEHFGRGVYLAAAPTTNYGRTLPREDLAEAVPAYLYGTDQDIDAIRKNAINNFFQDINAGKSTVEGVEVQAVEPSEYKKSIVIKPEKIGITPKYYKEITPQVNATGYQTVTSRLGKVVDDYGSTVDVIKRSQPATK